MNQFVACVSPDHGDEGRVSTPSRSPANLSPYEFYVSETQRRYRTLTDAGIESDMAFECASWAAMTKVAAMLNADDYEFSPNVYGD